MILILRFHKKNKALLFYLGLFLLILIPRLIYIYTSELEAGDTYLYMRIANNIRNGCGFSASISTSGCEPLTGVYFPAYPTLLAIFYHLGLSNLNLAIFTSIVFSYAVTHLSRNLFFLTRNQGNAFIIGLLIGLSPLSLGYSRMILIEPILSAIGLFILSEIVYIYFNRRSSIYFIIRLCVLVSIGFYFKPSIIMVIPLIFCCLYILYGIKRSFIGITSVILIVSITISPWLVRGYSLTDNALGALTGYASNSPKGMKEYQDWVASWSVSEYARNFATWPIWSNSPSKVVLNKGIFLSSSDALYVKDLIQKEFDTKSYGFSEKAIREFINLKEKQLDSYNILIRLNLYFLRTVSYFTNPLQSWGYNIEIGEIIENNSIIDYIKINPSLIYKVVFKVLLFLYRIGLYLLYLNCVLSTFSKLISLKQSNNLKRVTFKSYLIFVSFALIISHIIIFPILLNAVETRYLIFLTPWIELSVISHYLIRPNEKLRIDKTPLE